MSDQINLKPCPFCGGNVRPPVERRSGQDDISFMVHCHCGASFDGGSTVESAVRTWNRRAPNHTTILGRAGIHCDECFDSGRISSLLGGIGFTECLKCYAMDAKRYRWLRDPDNAAEVEHLVWTADSMDSFDAAIDSAMSKEAD